MNNSIILYRFHDSPVICRERIKLLRAFNPGVRIYGVYGGPSENAAAARAAVADLVVDVQTAQQHDWYWHWLHMDLDVKHWYRTVGSSLDFDFLFDYEWDLLTVDALTSIFPHIGQNAIALCSLTELTPEIENTWYHTAVGSDERLNYERFVEYMAREFGMGSLRYVSHGPGTLLSRRFLERFADTEDIELVISEISYPAYAQAFGFELHNNNFRSSAVTDHREDVYCNCNDKMIEYGRLMAQLARPNGRRAFHPVKYQVTLSQLEALGFPNTNARGPSSDEALADHGAVRTRLEAVSDRLEACLDGEAELRHQLAHIRGTEADLSDQIEEARLAVAERDARLHAIHSTRAWRAVTRWWSIKRRLTGR